MFVKLLLFLNLIFLFSINIYANIINVPDTYSTIQEAIDNAEVGDTVLVSSGTYIENINFEGKDIVVGSHFLLTENVEIIYQTIIRSDSGSIITFNNSESHNTVLCGFTITGGVGTVLSSSSGNELFGGGIFINNSSPTIKGNIITNNDMMTGANRGGGIAIKDSANPLIFRNTITDNDIIGILAWINYFGGGIWIDSTSNPIIGGDISNLNNIYFNTADNGNQVYRNGSGNIINAQYNYWGNCPPSSHDIFPLNQFDVSNCLENPVGVIEKHKSSFASNYYLSQNYPNPFNSSTTFCYSIKNKDFVQIKIYNITGKLVRTLINEEKSIGTYIANWNGRDEFGVIVSSGVYLYTLKIGKVNKFSKRMIMIK